MAFIRPIRARFCAAILGGFFSAAPFCPGQTRVDPTTWTLWRSDALALPNDMRPSVPELSPQSAIPFGEFGQDLCVVVPDVPATPTRDDTALRTMAGLIVQQSRRATIVPASDAPKVAAGKTLLLLGTAANNPLIGRALGGSADAFLRDVATGGYAIGTAASPLGTGKRCILAVGVDAAGAWSAACVMAFSVHPQRARLGALANWPTTLPDGAYWLPFEARVTVDPWAYEVRAPPNPAPSIPAIPFGVRVWGSPMPTLEGYQRIVRTLAAAGVNTVVVQSGGWVDRPDAPAIFEKALDIAWQEGLFTVLYVGNDEQSHHPAALSPNHMAVVERVKNHPGLLGWQLYNQLAATLTPEERDLVTQQIRWLRRVSNKPVGNEVVWGHNSVAMPADKQALVQDLAAAGNQVVATDYAPIGGWSKQPELSHWEGRLLELDKLNAKAEAVLQAHVPFLEPTVPSREQMRNQFWWALAGGASGFYYETAYNFTHFSVRGLLSWTGRPLPDGRYDELAALSATVKTLAPVVVGRQRLSDDEASQTHVRLGVHELSAALRLMRSPACPLFALVINGSTVRPLATTLSVDATGVAYEVTDIATGQRRGRLDAAHSLAVSLNAGGGDVYALRRVDP